MQIKLLAFAQTQVQLGFGERTVQCAPEETPRQILARLAPGFEAVAVRVAVDHEYHAWDSPIGQASELALIPPVSGG
jgi:molybdopterin synthase sulfur carrier subunit